MTKAYTLAERTPTVAEYNRIRVSAGLAAKSPIAAKRGLSNTLYAVCIEHSGEAVGIGRVIGDGGLFYDIVDIAVVAEHQGNGVGGKIMSALMKYLDSHAPATSLICLLSNRGVAGFYEKYGFQIRDPEMPAMIIRR